MASVHNSRRGSMRGKELLALASATAVDPEALMAALPKVERGSITAAAIGQELICPISGDTVAEVLEDSHDDVMVFALRVSRPVLVQWS